MAGTSPSEPAFLLAETVATYGPEPVRLAATFDHGLVEVEVRRPAYEYELIEA